MMIRSLRELLNRNGGSDDEDKENNKKRKQGTDKHGDRRYPVAKAKRTQVQHLRTIARKKSRETSPGLEQVADTLSEEKADEIEAAESETNEMERVERERNEIEAVEPETIINANHDISTSDDESVPPVLSQ